MNIGSYINCYISTLKSKKKKNVLCNEEEENLDNLFLKCTTAQAVLFRLDLSLRIEVINPFSLK